MVSLVYCPRYISLTLLAPAARGIFRIPGAHSVVEALYDHFCSMDEDGDVVAGTVRCPTLPDHIRCDVHDVASAFKKFLSGVPGGILGSLPLFDALVAIQGQLRGDAEFTRTKQSKVRARLIALAISTIRSQYRRELICAVFGLLCMIGRAAEISPREDERGRPLPTLDLMGYSALGIVFGPLLVGDLLDHYSMHLANPNGGLVLLPVSSPKSRKEKKKKRTTEDGTSFTSQIDKIKVANGITEMLITHWRDVVRHMRNMSALKVSESQRDPSTREPYLRPSVSEGFSLRKPPDWDSIKRPARRNERSESPTPRRRKLSLSTVQTSLIQDE
jgi:RhoGAP domain